MSHSRARTLGWERVDSKPWRSKCDARWVHKDGWILGHCGHQTAHYPWALYGPDGLMHCTGGQARFGRKPEHGTAWVSLDEAMAYVRDPAPHGDPSRPIPATWRR